MDVSSAVGRRAVVLIVTVWLVACVSSVGAVAHATPAGESSAMGAGLAQENGANPGAEAEPNDDRENATPVTPRPGRIANVVGGQFAGTINGTGEDETTADPDVDFFTFDASEGEAINLYTTSSIDVVRGVLYGPDGDVVSNVSGGPGDIFTGGTVLDETGTYYFRVESKFTYGYDIRYDFGFQIADPDPFEPNDDIEGATPVASGEHVNGTIPSGDADYFAVETDPGETITATVSLRSLPTDNPNNVAVDVLDSDGERVNDPSERSPRGPANATELTGEDTLGAESETVNATVEDGGTYYVRVSGASTGLGEGGFASYGLDIDTSGTNVSPTRNALVIVGGTPANKVTYAFTYDGTVERSGESHGAPIDDDGVTIDPDIDKISDSRVSGRLGGGGDAYLVTGNITGLRIDGDATAYLDGRAVDPATVGDVPDRKTATATETATATATPAPTVTPTSTPVPAATTTQTSTATATPTQTATQTAVTTPTTTPSTTSTSPATPRSTQPNTTTENESSGRILTDTSDEASGSSGPGFGVAVSLAAVFVVGLLTARRH